MKTCGNQLSVNLLYQQKLCRKVTPKANIYIPRIFSWASPRTIPRVLISGPERSSSSLDSHEQVKILGRRCELIRTVQVTH
jgi:hypothetical protein